jgi:hypothetical protein
MDNLHTPLVNKTSRRRFLNHALLGGVGLAAAPALAQQLIDLRLPGGNSDRPMTSAFPGKGSMILQRTHPPLLETPMDVFDKSVFTSNDQFFVRWHWADIPTSIDVTSFRLNVFGHVNRPLSISLTQLLKLPRVEMAAVNQCSGNSRGLFQPRVPGAQDFPTVPINRMIPRSWLTSLPDGQQIAFEPWIPIGGIAMGGDCGVAKVDTSSDGGRTWYKMALGRDEGPYSFRRWDGRVPLQRGANSITVRCWNTRGVAQPIEPIWNPGGFMRGNIETTTVIAGAATAS